MDKKLFFLGIGVAIVLVFAGTAAWSGVAKLSSTHGDRETLYQVSSMNALAQGAFDGIQPVSELKKHGDFGIGTFDSLNGEMIVLDGKVYQATADGNIRVAPDDVTTPFAEVTYFDRDINITEDRSLNYSEFTLDLTAKLPSKNVISAVKIHGRFPVMNVRSVPQQQKPFPTLVSAATNQSMYTYENAEGTIVGYYEPEFLNGIGVPGYHLHFISDDRRAGGHVLDFITERGMIVDLDTTTGFFAFLPAPDSSTGIDAAMNVSADLARAER
jgi:acetolactate decarboxylase